MPLAGRTIIIASAIPWEGDRHREHEIAALLSETCPVVFLEPPPTRHVNAPTPASAPGGAALWTEVITPALSVARPGSGPWPGASLCAVANDHNRRAIARRLREQLVLTGETTTILWVNEAAAASYIGRMGESLVVYDAADEAWAFSRHPLRRRLLKAYETRVTREADLVFASSEPLYEQKLPLNPHTHLAVNAVDYEHFASASAAPADAPVFIGFVGATLLKRTDYDLLVHIATQRPAWRVELVGPTQWPRRLPRPANLDCLGRRPYADLPEIMSRHSVCLIPYHPTGELSYIHPKKLFEYLAAGKPIVATDMPALRPYEGLVKIGRTPAEFLAKVEDCLAENRDPVRSAALIEARRTLARGHSWRQRVEEMVVILEAALDERAQASRG